MTHAIRMEDDIWRLPSANVTYLNYYELNFSVIKQSSLKNQVKRTLFEMIRNDSVKTSTIFFYYNNFKNAFFAFMKENSIEIDWFSDITSDVANKYILYLRSRKGYSPISNSNAVAAIKSIIDYAIVFKIENTPDFNPFPQKTSRIFGIDDELKTRAIDENQISMIEAALLVEEDIYTKALITIAKDTGLRISEILTITYDCLLEDFDGFPILVTYSIKSEKERYVTASKDVIEVIEQLREEYVENDGLHLFFIKKKNGYKILSQSEAREMLKRFCDKNNIDRHSPHAFRHTMGTIMLRNGATGSQIKTQLGLNSLHTTSQYAKLNNLNVDNEYYRMPPLGIERANDVEIELDLPVLPLWLPDGRCLNTLKDNSVCESSFKCFFCNLFVTFPSDLPTHKMHLERIKEDKLNYMIEEGVNSLDLLIEIERALEEIIRRLESNED